MSRPVVAFFDGSVRPAPDGYMSGAWWIVKHPGVESLEEDVTQSWCWGRGMGGSQQAECRAAIAALHALSLLGHEGPVALHGDCRFVIDQFNGGVKVVSSSMRKLGADLRRAAGRFERVEMIWVPRKDNRAADHLARLAYREAAARDLVRKAA